MVDETQNTYFTAIFASAHLFVFVYDFKCLHQHKHWQNIYYTYMTKTAILSDIKHARPYKYVDTVITLMKIVEPL